MFEGLSVTSSNSVAPPPPTTSNNSTNLTSLFGDMSVQVCVNSSVEDESANSALLSPFSVCYV